MATNELLPFGMGDSPNRIPFEDWNTLHARLTGFQSGIASSQQFNYILSQGGVAGYILGQLIVDFAQQDATLDNADALYSSLKNALAAFVPGNIADKSILTAKIADAAITTVKLADANVTTGKLANKAVTTAKLADLAVTAAQIAASAVTNDKIAAGTIAFDRLASAAVATQEQAVAGTASNVLMTPQRVAQAIAAQIPPSIPSGFILPFAGTSIPDGWLICNGAAVSRTEYAALFSAIGTKWGEGDGSTTFNLPDLDERFIEGTVDTSKVGEYVEAGLPDITGSSGMLVGYPNDSPASGCFTRENSGSANMTSGNLVCSTEMTMKASLSNSAYGGVTVQPEAAWLLFAIKF